MSSTHCSAAETLVKLGLAAQAQDHLFVVGTDGGALHKCSTAYASEYLASYAGHDMAVYSVRWNACHPRSFVSASADWSVKLWDSTLDEVCPCAGHMQTVPVHGAVVLGTCRCLAG